MEQMYMIEFEILGKKYRTSIMAENAKTAKNIIKNKVLKSIKFFDITCKEPEFIGNSQIFESLMNIFGNNGR